MKVSFKSNKIIEKSTKSKIPPGCQSLPSRKRKVLRITEIVYASTNASNICKIRVRELRITVLREREEHTCSS